MFTHTSKLKPSMRRIDPSDLALSVLETGFRLGKVIAAARKARGLSQAALCELANVGRNTLGEIEKGSPRVQFAYWLLVMDALELLDKFNAVLTPAEAGLLADAIRRPRKG